MGKGVLLSKGWLQSGIIVCTIWKKTNRGGRGREVKDMEFSGVKQNT